MIRLIEALNFRCLRYIRQSLADFQVLVGPNASGKTTFLDVVKFLSDLLSLGLDDALASRSKQIRDLFFFGKGDRFELAVELAVPEERLKMLRAGVRAGANGDTEKALLDAPYRYVRYEVSIGVYTPDGVAEEYHIFDEQVLLLRKPSGKQAEAQRTLFPNPPHPPDTIMHVRSVRGGKRRVVRKVYGGNDNFYSEISPKKGKGGWAPSYRLGPRKSALANLPDDEKNFPVSTWLRETLVNGTQKLMLNSLALRRSSPPGQGRLFTPDGSNLPWVIEGLRKADMERYRQWIEQVKTALPDVKHVVTGELPDVKHRFLQIIYEAGLKVPSWTASDGTLRLLALTLPAYLPEFEGIYLIEEPENGIHPMAMETVFQALHSVYGAQILLATHSPVILGCAEPKDILCFKKRDDDGATDIVAGPEHPALRHWQSSFDLSELYASGILG